MTNVHHQFSVDPVWWRYQNLENLSTKVLSLNFRLRPLQFCDFSYISIKFKKSGTNKMFWTNSNVKCFTKLELTLTFGVNSFKFKSTVERQLPERAFEHHWTWRDGNLSRHTREQALGSFKEDRRNARATSAPGPRSPKQKTHLSGCSWKGLSVCHAAGTRLSLISPVGAPLESVLESAETLDNSGIHLWWNLNFIT